MKIGGWGVKYNSFLDKFCLKEPLVLKIFLGMVFESKNSKMTSKFPERLLVLSSMKVLSKFTVQYTPVKKTLQLSKPFFSYSFLSIIKLIW